MNQCVSQTTNMCEIMFYDIEIYVKKVIKVLLVMRI